MNKKTILNDFKIEEKIKLDTEEEELLLGVKGSRSIASSELINNYQQIALNQKKRTKQLSMRLTDSDYLLAKARGIEEGMPYQVLLSSIIHKWLHGKLKEV